MLTREQLLRGDGVQVDFRPLRLRRAPQLLPLQRRDALEVELGLLPVSAGAHRGLPGAAGGEVAAGGRAAGPVACREAGGVLVPGLLSSWQGSPPPGMLGSEMGPRHTPERTVGLLPGCSSMPPLRHTFRHSPSEPSDPATPSTRMHMKADAGAP